MDKKIAVIGDAESIKGFGAVGFDTFPSNGAEQAGRLLRQLADSDAYGIIYLTESLYLALDKEVSRYKEKLLPAVIPIPGANANYNLGTKRLSSLVEKAVGSDIIFNN